MDVRHRPNEDLRFLLREAGWTGQDLARAVNAAGAEAGVALRYDRSAVSHWLNGMRPRHPVPDLIAEALSRRFDRQLTVEEIGLAATGARAVSGLDPGRAGQGALMADLLRLSELQDADRRKMMSACVYSLTALSVPAWAHAPVERAAAPSAHMPPVDAGTVAAVEAVARVFAQNDAAFGGGSARQAAAAYLSHDVAPKLEARARPAVRRGLHTIAAQLAYLCGFMCFDEELHGLAQRYYLMALKLATGNGDGAAYAVTLRAMSVQARLLGHHRHAVQLAETAAKTSRRLDPGRQAFLYGQLAVAHAAEGDRASALACLTSAERRLDRASCGVTPLVGAYHPASLAHQQAAVRALLGDRKGAISALAVSIQGRPETERRSRAITLARMAELQLRQGYLEEAVSSWHRFLDDVPHLSSGRAVSAGRTMRTLLRPHGTHPAVRLILARAAAQRRTASARA